MIRYVTQGGVKLELYVSLHKGGGGVKNDRNWRYVIVGRPLTSYYHLFSTRLKTRAASSDYFF